MPPTRSRRATVLVGCGRLGSALVEGWLKTGAVAARDLIILTPRETPAAKAARAAGARINPSLEALADAEAMVLAVKPAKWREATTALIPALAADAAVISVMAGVTAASLGQAFAGRPVARVMPTTGVAQGQGAASIWARDEAAMAGARRLFDPVARVVELEDEALIDVATAVSGSGAAYFFAFTEALARAGVAAGLDPETAGVLARATLASAAASAGADHRGLPDLIAQVASPGGTTEAGLKALADAGLADAVDAAVTAAARRASELSRD